MTLNKDQEWYLQVEQLAIETLIASPIPYIAVHSGNPQKAFLYTFDSAYALGFEAAKKMAAEGIDIQALDTEKLSLIPDPDEPTQHAVRPVQRKGQQPISADPSLPGSEPS